jgi:5-methylcytosine-specific restriction endonuclease McrA
MKVLLTREEARQKTLDRDHNKCIICNEINELTIHHIIDRSLFKDQGYYIDNLITLCPVCHIKSENGTYTCNELREKANIDNIVLPDGYDNSVEIDKWAISLKKEC